MRSIAYLSGDIPFHTLNFFAVSFSLAVVHISYVNTNILHIYQIHESYENIYIEGEMNYYYGKKNNNITTLHIFHCFRFHYDFVLVAY